MQRLPTPTEPSDRGRAAVRVIGIDPGTRRLGWAVLDHAGSRITAVAHGCLRAPERRPMSERLALLAGGLRTVLGDHTPAEAAVEEAFHGRDARAALRLGEGRGMVLLVLGEAGLTCTGYANNVVKRSVGGGGRASKQRVRDLVTRMLGLTAPPETDDASDALAVALCHLHRRGGPGGGPAGPSARFAEAVRRAAGGR